MKSEKGSTLITVLLIMAVFTVIGLSLFSMNMNDAKQISNTAEDIQATNLAEMAATGVKEEIFALLNSTSYSQKSLDDMKGSLPTDLAGLLNKDFTVKSTANSPKFRILQASVNNQYTQEGATQQVLSIDFTVTGTSQNNQPKTITGTINYTRGKSEGFPPKPAGATEVPASPAMVYDTNYDGIKSQIMYYDNGFSMYSNSSLRFTSDLYAKGIINQAANTDLWVNGNAYVQQPYPKTNQTGNGNLGLMCVDKTLYVPSSLIADSDFKAQFHLLGSSLCSDVFNQNPPQNGIYAKALQPLPFIGSGNWGSNNITIFNVQYK